MDVEKQAPGEDKELEKRRLIMSNVRTQIYKDMAEERQKKFEAKEKEVEAKEEAKRRQEADQLYLDRQKQDKK